MNAPEAVAAFMFFGGTFWVLRPVAAAIAKRIAGEHRRPAPDPGEIEDLRADLEQVRQELGEMAERVDFAERLLAQQRDRALPPK
jgi:hypothetical protein